MILGRWKGTKHAAIVDFSPTNDYEVYSDIKDKMIKSFPHRAWKNEFFAVRNKHDDNSLLKVAKLYLDEWNLPSKIELAHELINPAKILLKDLEVGFKKRKSLKSPTEQLSEYIDTLNKNLENLQTLLNSIE